MARLTKLLSSILLLVLAVAAVSYYAYSSLTTPQGVISTTTTTTSTTGSQSQQQAAPNTSYDCALPAVTSSYSCDKLPAGYVIAPRLFNAPDPQRPSGMTDSAWSLFQQTWANGVCDPNEAVWTNPLDCGCTGALGADPYTGRCSVPATVCQAQPGAG